MSVIASGTSKPANLLTMVVLSRGKCGLSTCATRYLVAMSTADLLVIVTEVILRRIRFRYFPRSFLDITPVRCVNIALASAATDCSVWFTVAFTFDRFVAICCWKLKTKYCTGKTAAAVLPTIGILLCLKNVPFYFTRTPALFIEGVPWFTKMKPSYFTEPGWMAFDWLNSILTPLLPFAGILLLNVLTVRSILAANRVRKGLKGLNKDEKRRDPNLETRRRSVVLLFAVSGSFVLLWLTTVVQFIHYRSTGTGGRWSESVFILGKVGLILRNVNCCTNTFIYAATQSKFRQQVKEALMYPDKSKMVQWVQCRDCYALFMVCRFLNPSKCTDGLQNDLMALSLTEISRNERPEGATMDEIK
ncbi:probable G-protein coupled receptor 139 [Narcine bancroftii]|uniref:probable G-protein coupled receptor 139 n=1 Tax=Narcine bancroftii TaxID=1343680 RepID=UPI0038311B51